MPDRPEDIPRDAIRDVLLKYWDPSNAERFESSRNEYDALIEPLWEMISNASDESLIIDFLRERESEWMCFPGLGITRLKLPAQKLLALRNRE